MDLLGFKFPKEHGLVAFWIATILLSVFPSLFLPTDWIGLIIGLLFSTVVVFSYIEIKKMIKSGFKKIAFPQLIVVFLCTLLALFYNFNRFTFILFTLLSILVLFWVILALKNRRHDFNELGFGVSTLTLHFGIIFSLGFGINSFGRLAEILSIWWLYAGIANATTIRVGSMRNKISHNTPIIRTILFSLSLIPLFIQQYLHPLFIIVLIEPIVQNYIQFVTKPTIKGSSIKQVGYSLVISLSFSVLLISTVMSIQLT